MQVRVHPVPHVAHVGDLPAEMIEVADMLIAVQEDTERLLKPRPVRWTLLGGCGRKENGPD